MSALKLFTVASSFGVLGASALYTARTPSRDFAAAALTLDHLADEKSASLPVAGAVKAKLPANFVSFKVGPYEVKNAA